MKKQRPFIVFGEPAIEEGEVREVRDRAETAGFERKSLFGSGLPGEGGQNK